MPFDNPATYPVSTEIEPVTALLEDAWRLIDRPQKWCRGQPESIDGRRLCSMTALQVTVLRRSEVIRGDSLTDGYFTPPDDYITALGLLGIAMGGSIMGFNDTRTHAELADAWQRAIAMSRHQP